MTGRRNERCSSEKGKNKGEGGEAKENEGMKKDRRHERKETMKSEGANKEVGVRDFKNQTINDGS